jgi:hypothetical protein
LDERVERPGTLLDERVLRGARQHAASRPPAARSSKNVPVIEK